MAALTAVAINTRGIMEEMVIDHTNSGVIQKKAWRESNIYRFFKNLDRKVVLAVLVIVGVNCTVWAAIGVVLVCFLPPPPFFLLIPLFLCQILFSFK